MKTLSTLVLALVLVGGCAHEEDHSTGPRASRTSGGDQRAHTRTARRQNDDGANAPSAATVAPAEEAPVASASAVGADAQGGAAPIASAPGSNPPTAQQQSMANTDEDITRQIRRSVVGDGSLSIAARNATIVTQSGVVTLRGSVPDDEERAALERHARAVSGVSRVDNRVAVRN